MSTLDKLLDTGTLAASVYAINGNSEDAAAAAGYGAWVASVTGTYPSVIKGEVGQAKVLLTKGQIVAMQQWLDRQIIEGVLPATRDKKSTLDIQFGPVITPLAIKYVMFIAAAGFVLGWFGHKIVR